MLPKTIKKRVLATVWKNVEKIRKNTRAQLSLWKVAHAIHLRRRSQNTVFHFEPWTKKTKENISNSLPKTSKNHRKSSQNRPQNLSKTGRAKKTAKIHHTHQKNPKRVPSWNPTRGGTSPIIPSFSHLGRPWTPNGRPALKKGARGAQSHQNGAQSIQNGSKMDAQNHKNGAKNPQQIPFTNSRKIGEYSVLLMTGQKKRSTGPSAVAGMAEGSWIYIYIYIYFFFFYIKNT